MGFPLRDSLFTGQKERAARFLEFDGSRPVLLVVGGSSGSVAINEAVKAALPKLLETYDVVHVMGKTAYAIPIRRTISLSPTPRPSKIFTPLPTSSYPARGRRSVRAFRARKIRGSHSASRGRKPRRPTRQRLLRQKYGAVVLEQADLSTQTLLSAIAEAKSVKMRPMSRLRTKKSPIFFCRGKRKRPIAFLT